MTPVACLVSAVSLGSCEKVPLLAPTASVITVVSSRSVLPVDGTAQIIATVIEQSGTPAHNGTLVTFTSTLGTLDPQEAVTSNGQAVVTLRAGTQSGTASVAAFSGSARTETPVTVLIGGAAAAAVSVTANPAVVPSTGGTVVVSASVSDADGNTLAGVPVTFSTTAGTLGATLVTSAVSGQASTTLVTNSAATVTATAGSRSATVAVAVNDAPTVVVSTTTTTPTVGAATVFSVTTTAPGSPITGVTIDFGDGTSLSLGSLTGTTSVSHVYTVSGAYTIVGTVTDSGGQQVSVSTVINVAALTPLNVVLTSTTTSPTVNAPVSFSAAVTPSTVAILRYEWAFGDGASANTSGASTSHAYSSPGLKTATVTAVSQDGREGTGQLQVLIVQSVPTASFVFSPTAPTTATLVQFNATASTAPAGSTVSGYAWSFGDGSTGTGATTTHTFTTAGVYNVLLTVTDTASGTASTSSPVTVIAAATPTASFVVSPTAPTTATLVQFNAAASTAPAGTTIAGYAWNFGDGSTGTGVTTSHTFTAAGVYNVVLAVTDSAGETATTSVAVTVTAASPTAAFVFSPAAPTAGVNVQFNGNQSTAPTGRTIVSYAWNFGDGTSETGASAIVGHVFSTAGTVTVTLTVTDSTGATATETKTVPVS
jgi:PKD repeat protein